MSPSRVQQAQQRPILMTRRQLTDPFGSDDEEENIQIIDDKSSQSIAITKSQSPVRDVSIYVYIYEIAQIYRFLYIPSFILCCINNKRALLCCIFYLFTPLHLQGKTPGCSTPISMKRCDFCQRGSKYSYEPFLVSRRVKSALCFKIYLLVLFLRADCNCAFSLKRFTYSERVNLHVNMHEKIARNNMFRDAQNVD